MLSGNQFNAAQPIQPIGQPIPPAQLGNLVSMLGGNQDHIDQNRDPRYSPPKSDRYDDRDRRDDRDRHQHSRQNQREKSRGSGVSKDKSVGPGPDCVPSYPDPSVPSDCIKYLSRTIFISDVAPSMNACALRELLELHARIETVRLNSSKGQAFVKIATRKEAENVKNILTGYRIGKHMFKIGWGCGYGPREHFNYTDGFTMFPIAKIPDNDKKVIETCPPRYLIFNEGWWTYNWRYRCRGT